MSLGSITGMKISTKYYSISFEINRSSSHDPKQLLETIYKSLDEINENINDAHKLIKAKNTVLFGEDGQLDSLGLINLLITIEQNIADKFDKSITITDERAMSQENSPFRTVGSLTDYIEMLLDEKLD